MGSLQDHIDISEEYENTVTKYWVSIYRYLKKLPVSGLKVYQDSLPNTEKTSVERIVDETQTANFEILKELRNRGALILGTESPALLHEDYKNIQAVVEALDLKSRVIAIIMYKDREASLLEERDHYLAQRINQTLQPEERGLLLLGFEHNAKSKLNPDIIVRQPRFVQGFLPPLYKAYLERVKLDF